jgi:hypothetical protein
MNMNTVTTCRHYDLVAEALERADSSVRADSRGRPANAAGILTSDYIRRLAEVRGDAVAGRVASVLRDNIGIDYRADSSRFFADELTDRDNRVTIRPERPNALVAAIPVSPVEAWDEYFTAKTATFAGKAVPTQRGSTDTVIVDYGVSEEKRPMQMFRADTADFIGDAERRAKSVSPITIAEETAQAIRYHLLAHNSLLRDGLAGFGGYSLATLPATHRLTSTVTYGDLTAGQPNAALAEFRRICSLITTKAPELERPDTMLCTPRFFEKLGGYVNFETGASDFSEEMIRRFLTSRGIRVIEQCIELENFSAANEDLVVLFNAASEYGLKQKLGLAPAPVKTFDVDLSRRTAFLSSTGGLYAKHPGAVVLYNAKVTAN